MLQAGFRFYGASLLPWTLWKKKLCNGQKVNTTTIPQLHGKRRMFFVRKSVFETLNGFDSTFFMHFEEIDFCLRAKNMGHKIWYVGASCVYHPRSNFTTKVGPESCFTTYELAIDLPSRYPSSASMGLCSPWIF